jgi:hypothetical protein
MRTGVQGKKSAFVSLSQLFSGVGRYVARSNGDMLRFVVEQDRFARYGLVAAQDQADFRQKAIVPTESVFL